MEYASAPIGTVTLAKAELALQALESTAAATQRNLFTTPLGRCFSRDGDKTELPKLFRKYAFQRLVPPSAMKLSPAH